jgi:type II secretory pathway component PulF
MREFHRVKKVEEVFPDFLQLVASNLRAGMTVDRALILSAREEFAPLDTEIKSLGKDIITGKELVIALNEMAERINSEKVTKTIYLLNTGIRSGGNISVLLEQISSNMREKSFVEKKASSSVLMYVIFVFFAVSVGAPALFALSSVMVEVLIGVISGLPESSMTSGLPVSFSHINISMDFILIYSVVFLIVLGILASFILGIVNKGNEKEGLKYIIPLLAISLTVFFSIRYIFSGFFSNLFG